jgi:hypothetical protein
MYVIKDKTKNELLFVSYAERDINLKPIDIFPGFDPAKMEFGWCGSTGIPEHYKIDADGQIIELSTEEKVAKGIITLAPSQKLENNRVIEKTLTEKVKEGLITLNPDQEITGEGDNQTIVAKTIPKLVADGTIKLQPNQKLDGDTIVLKTDREMLDEGVMTLDEFKQKRIQYYSNLSLAQRQVFLPDYKLQNVALGLYDDAKVNIFKATVQAFKDEFNRLEGLVKQAPDANAVDAIAPNYPDKLVE